MYNDNGPLKEFVKPGVFKIWQKVDAEIDSFSDLGITVIINDEYLGLVYGDQVYEDYEVGDRLDAYITAIRDDGKIDLSFQPRKEIHVFQTAGKIMAYLRQVGGTSTFSDKSSPEDIEEAFQVSKVVFKQAIGRLLKQRRIKKVPGGIEIVKRSWAEWVISS